MAQGRLAVVGTGIRVTHLTPEARTYITSADVVLYAVYDPATETLIKELQPSAETLATSYAEGKPRTQTYAEMIERILGPVREGRRVCVALYGHPGIFVDPSHAAIRRARAEGHQARMLPAVSSLDCLFADLGVDPARGCQMYEATDLLIRRRTVDPSAVLIVWQIGVIGELAFRRNLRNGQNLRVLGEYLGRIYGDNHEVTVYEAASPVRRQPLISIVRLDALAESQATAVSTLYVPPKYEGVIDPAVAERLGLSLEAFPGY